MGDKETVKAGYDAIADDYLSARSEGSEDVQLLQELADRLPEGAKVLDAGCGAGAPVARMLSQRFEVTGVDFAEAQVKLARKLVPRAQFFCQDMTELSFPDGSFDAVCSYYAIIHVPREEHRRLLLNFHRILEPSGLALLCMGAGDLPTDVGEDYFGVRMFWSHYDADTNIKLLAECGFDIIWSKIVADESSPGSAHLFVLARRGD